MPLRLEIKKKLTSRSERVKCVDLHPSQPLVLAALYSGTLMIWNYESQSLVKSFEATTQPIRCAKFITRKQWIVAGSDDMMLRVYNFNTLEKVAEFEAHVDYIRSLEVHPTLPYILSGSDDMQIKLWDWEKLNLASFSTKSGKTIDVNSNSQAFDGHAHYIMCIKFNPKDSNTFATASLDRTIKVWSLGSPLPNYSLEGHEQGVNYVDYFLGGEKPYLISGADDMTIKIWDYQTKSCVQTLTGHTGNVSSVIYHPKLPLIVSGSEDGTVRLWHSVTYRLETTLNYGLERSWCVAASRESSRVAIGFDEGTVVIALGSDEVLASMEGVNGKVLLVKNNEISQINVRKKSGTEEILDGESMNLEKKELGICDFYPQSISHNSNGRFVALVGDGKYIIYTAQALRDKAFGECLDLAWSSESTGDYAILRSSKVVQVFRNFDESKGFEKRLSFAVDKLQPGPLLGLVFGSGEFVVFIDWESGLVVRKIDVSCSKIVWNQSGSLVALISDDPEAEGVFILGVDQAMIGDKLQDLLSSNCDKEEDFSDNFEDCFSLTNEIAEGVESGVWVGDCFLYVNKKGTKLNYHINGENVTLANLDRKMFLLNYVAKENRIYLIDQQQEIVSFELLESVLQYQTAVVREDFDLANQILDSVPESKMDDIARFLEGQDYKDLALQLAKDNDLRFSLAMGLEKLADAHEIMLSLMASFRADKEQLGATFTEEQEVKSKWRQLCDLALSKGDIFLAEECAKAGEDLSSLFLIYTALGDKTKLKELAELARNAKQMHLAFSASFMINDLQGCTESLCKSERFSEAAMFSRFYVPSELPETIEIWKKDLSAKGNQIVADSIADNSNSSFFPNVENSSKRINSPSVVQKQGLSEEPLINSVEEETLRPQEIVENSVEAELPLDDKPSKAGNLQSAATTFSNEFVGHETTKEDVVENIQSNIDDFQPNENTFSDDFIDADFTKPENEFQPALGELQETTGSGIDVTAEEDLNGEIVEDAQNSASSNDDLLNLEEDLDLENDDSDWS